jgi:hypothetical protein
MVANGNIHERAFAAEIAADRNDMDADLLPGDFQLP